MATDYKKSLNILRRQGYGGGFILKHRALLTLPIHPLDLVLGVVLAILLFGAWLLALPFVTQFWAIFLEYGLSALSLPDQVELVRYSAMDLYEFDFPHIELASGLPDFAAWWIATVVTVLVFVGSFFLPKNKVPLIYLVRFIAAVQGVSQVYFLLTPETFPYNLSGYIAGIMLAGLALITLIPLILGFTYNIFYFGLWKKLSLAILTMGHLIVLVPLQYLTQAYILHHSSLMFMPVLFVIFGLPLDIMVFIALYAWGMTWKQRRSSDLRGRRAAADREAHSPQDRRQERA
ncbi:MAG: hypothetical protein HY942_03665 [Gammaproteobacteria bacterium]|nr:hypothetical protein [Gammaproteobacteria bacterium]